MSALSFSHPEINTSPLHNTSRGDEEEYLGDESEGSLSHLTSSLPDLVTLGVDPRRRKKLRRKRRAESERSETTRRTRGPEKTPNTPNRPTLSPSLPPLRSTFDLLNSIGRRRGICGTEGQSGYLEVWLFTLFYFSDQFDSWLLEEQKAKDFPTRSSRSLRSVLKKEVLFSLRTSYFCPSVKVAKVSSLLFPGPSSPSPPFLHVSNFLHHFLHFLTVQETLHYTNGLSKLLHVLKDRSLKVKGHKGQMSEWKWTTLQHLFELSLGDLKLLSVPQPGLFLSVLDHPHPPLIPNLQLDLTPVLIQISDDNDSHSDTQFVPNAHPSPKGSAVPPLKEWALCRCIRKVARETFEHLQNLVTTLPSPGWADPLGSVDIDSSWTTTTAPEAPQESALRTKDVEWNIKRGKGKLPLALDLMAVLCLSQTTHKYTAFVRCGQNPRRGWAQWVHYDPLDQGAPVVRRVDEMAKWLRKLEKRQERVSGWSEIPEDLRLILTTSCFFVYTPKPDYGSQATLFSLANEL